MKKRDKFALIFKIVIDTNEGSGYAGLSARPRHQAVGSASGRDGIPKNALYASDGRRDILRPEPEDADSVENDRV